MRKYIKKYIELFPRLDAFAFCQIVPQFVLKLQLVYI